MDLRPAPVVGAGRRPLFVLALAAGGVVLIFTASTTTLLAAALAIIVVGVMAGSMYVVGFTLLHERVADELRGRAFGSLFTLVRLAVMTAFVLGPAISEAADAVAESRWDRVVQIWGWDLFIPGVRVTMWLAGLVIVFASLVAAASLRTMPAEDEQ